MSAINIDHKTGTIQNSDDSVLQLQQTGGVKIGDGTYLDELGNITEIDVTNEDYKGVLRYNNDKACLQYSDGRQWIDINGQYKQTSDIIWALLF